ncbi:cation diffusion facilitator family transporter [Brachyspira hampsonii]|uniref:cation diffusion facilitator family transporter n=1 Tax=Brachyspira hampsonii TaxID=1287055 RepID=UPI000D3CB228|nr:cation diffusion facilitator family transporter [Brachyspira hampsonii]PTY40249.1 cation transporter [Brachyspira hampsonii bv. II]
MNHVSNEKKSKYMIIEGVVSVIINILLFAFKYIVGLLTGSLSIMADAWHSLSDCISSVIVIIGGIFSKRPPDKEHPFGHGRIELITSFIVGIMLVFIGYSFFSEAIKNIMNKKTASFTTMAIIAMIVSILVKELLAQYSLWGYRKSGSKSLYADAWHHRSDSVTSIIILVGILFGKSFWWIDGVLSILVSLVIFYAAFDVIKSSVKPLIGEYPSEEIIKSINDIAKELNINDDAANLHHFHIHTYGDHSEITFHMRFPKDMTVFEAHNNVSTFENEIRKKLNIEPTIHIEAYK